MLNLFSFAGLRLSIHRANGKAVDGERWTLKQVQGDGWFSDSHFVANTTKFVRAATTTLRVGQIMG